MKEHHWLVSVVRELNAYAEDKKISGMTDGLRHILHEYALEAGLSEAEKAALLERLPGQEREHVDLRPA
ncbi:hypothetical protein ACOTTU_10020 [Roseobacter sp. EG26]|uniref:hypothetical protein n=1 Tax=Roseobacter sp. EG26 TaxID=3412477 RepID=UPI003CE4695E